MQASILREKFLDFFRQRRHKIAEPDSLVPKDDPTVLFTPAGMNQFKREFLGLNSGPNRLATCQRCLRTDDLDKVGKTPGHHTFFEMLGNFSFGDYFKQEAISWAWEFLTEELKIKKDKLWVSVYRQDRQAYDIWKGIIKLPAEKIIKLGDKENFWPSEAKAKGPNGPCGPCSEIFFQQGKDKKGLLEVWNLVFTQFNRKPDATLEPLPKKNIDTGMGLERLAAVMQGVRSNFQTDLFQPIIKEIAQGLSPKACLPARQGTVPEKSLVYAIADHIRAIAFAIYDGVLPSNESRGYVIRKLIRKSVLHLKSLGINQPFLYKLVPAVAGTVVSFYPDLEKRKENIAEIILAEEKNFISTLKSSPKLFAEKFAGQLKKDNPQEAGPPAGEAGRIAFKLYDTYGIPLELTEEWLNSHKVNFDRKAFEEELTAQKRRSKMQSSMQGDVFGAGALDYGVKETKFLGYQFDTVKAKIIKLFKDNKEVKKVSSGENAAIILDKTVFYAEAGGQVADSGELVKGKNIFTVDEAKQSGKAILHLGKVKSGSLKKNDFLLAKIDAQRRLDIARNHTATHLLQGALRKVLGPHVKQQGSLVASERLRFDFTHFKDISPGELERIEEIVNENIMHGYPLETKVMPLAQAKKSGALAFFGEKYTPRVRVVGIADVSRELCGGTHLSSTSAIGIFKIIKEASVASGIRRIEAKTGRWAYQAIKQEAEMLNEGLQKRLLRIKELEKQVSAKKTDALKISVDADIEKAETINGTKLVLHIDTDANAVRQAADFIKEKLNNNTVVFSSTGTNLKTTFYVVSLTADLCERGLDAARIIQEISAQSGGSGGGRKDFAQAGGVNPKNFDKIKEKIKNIINNLR